MRAEHVQVPWRFEAFPFLFGGTFIEGGLRRGESPPILRFPFLFGETFIEGKSPVPTGTGLLFPFLFGGTFIEGLRQDCRSLHGYVISLPFRRDFH